MKFFINVINKLNNCVIVIFRWLSATLFAGLCLCIITQIFMRRILNRPFVWTEDLVVVLFVWLTYIGAAVLYENKKLIKVELFTASISKKANEIIMVIIDLLIAMFSVYVSILSYRFMNKQIKLGHKLGGGLGLPSWTTSICIIASISSMALSSFVKIMNKIFNSHYEGQ